MNKKKYILVGILLLSFLLAPMVISMTTEITKINAINLVSDIDTTDEIESEEVDLTTQLSHADSESSGIESNEIRNTIPAVPGTKVRAVVTPATFIRHFNRVAGTTYTDFSNSTPPYGVLTLTPDMPNRTGSAMLRHKIDLDSPFHLVGDTDLGNKSSDMGGGFGIGFGFHNQNVGMVGSHGTGLALGNGMGIAGIDGAFAFKLDTFFHSEWTHEIANDALINGIQPSAFGSFIYQSGWGQILNVIGSAKNITPPMNNDLGSWNFFNMNYNEKSRILNINAHPGVNWERNIDDANPDTSFLMSATTSATQMNRHALRFTSMEYTTVVLPFEGTAVSQRVTVGEDLTRRNLNSFVTNLTYGGVPLVSTVTDYNVTLKEAKNDLVGASKATVIVEYLPLGITIEIEVPLEVVWGDTILARGMESYSVGAYTYHPSGNTVTANQGLETSMNFVHTGFQGRKYYSVDLYRLTTVAPQKLTDTNNYLSYTVEGQVFATEAASNFSNGTGVVNTQVGDIIEFSHEEAEENLSRFIDGEPQSLPTNNQGTFLELAATGYRQLFFNLLNVTGTGEITAQTTDQEIDAMLGDFLTNSNFETVSILGFSQYPDRSIEGSTVGKILVEETLSTGRKIQFEYDVNFEVTTGLPESIELTPETVTIKTGEEIQLVAKVLPESPENSILEWESSNEEIATVDATGLVFGQRQGEVIISAETNNGLRATSNIQVEILEIPDVDPTNPPVEVEPGNPNEGSLAIRYVSSLDFGESRVIGSGQELNSFPSLNQGGEPMLNMVTIQDIRPASQRNGWQLQVRQTSQLAGETEIIMNPYVHESYLSGNHISPHEGALTLNTNNQIFASANELSPHQIISFGMHHPQADGVRLLIPPGMGVGTYQTTLIWNLVSGPS